MRKGGRAPQLEAAASCIFFIGHADAEMRDRFDSSSNHARATLHALSLTITGRRLRAHAQGPAREGGLAPTVGGPHRRRGRRRDGGGGHSGELREAVSAVLTDEGSLGAAAGVCAERGRESNRRAPVRASPR